MTINRTRVIIRSIKIGATIITKKTRKFQNIEQRFNHAYNEHFVRQYLQPKRNRKSQKFREKSLFDEDTCKVLDRGGIITKRRWRHFIRIGVKRLLLPSSGNSARSSAIAARKSAIVQRFGTVGRVLLLIWMICAQS